MNALRILAKTPFAALCAKRQNVSWTYWSEAEVIARCARRPVEFRVTTTAASIYLYSANHRAFPEAFLFATFPAPLS